MFASNFFLRICRGIATLKIVLKILEALVNVMQNIWQFLTTPFCPNKVLSARIPKYEKEQGDKDQTLRVGISTRSLDHSVTRQTEWCFRSPASKKCLSSADDRRGSVARAAHGALAWPDPCSSARSAHLARCSPGQVIAYPPPQETMAWQVRHRVP